MKTENKNKALKTSSSSSKTCKTKPRKQEETQEQTCIGHQNNGTVIEQRGADGFINGTAMCKVYSKEIRDWLRTKETLELFLALATDLGVEIKAGNYPDLSGVRLSASKYTKAFPDLIFSRVGSPETGGGTWLHPDLAIQLAQWCNPLFAIQVSRWVREWITVAYHQEQQVQYNRRVIGACVTADASTWQKRFDNIFKDEACRITGQPPQTAWFICKYLYEQMPVDVRQDSFIRIMRLSPDNNLKQFKLNLEKAFSTTLLIELPIFNDLEETQ